MANHRADIVTSPTPLHPDGLIIELQHSGISASVIQEREAFYGQRLLWIFDGTNLAEYSLEIERIPRELAKWKLPNGQWQAIKTKKVDKELVKFRWKHPRKSYAVPRQRTYIDLAGDFLLQLDRFTTKQGPPYIGRGRLIPRARVEGWLR